MGRGGPELGGTSRKLVQKRAILISCQLAA